MYLMAYRKRRTESFVFSARYSSSWRRGTSDPMLVSSETRGEVAGGSRSSSPSEGLVILGLEGPGAYGPVV